MTYMLPIYLKTFDCMRSPHDEFLCAWLQLAIWPNGSSVLRPGKVSTVNIIEQKHFSDTPGENTSVPVGIAIPCHRRGA